MLAIDSLLTIQHFVNTGKYDKIAKLCSMDDDIDLLKSLIWQTSSIHEEKGANCKKLRQG